MFEDLSNKLEGVLKKIRGQGKITEKNVDESLREIRRVLFDADVNAFTRILKASPFGSFIYGGIQEDLLWCIRKNNGCCVSPFYNEIIIQGSSPLGIEEKIPDDSSG